MPNRRDFMRLAGLAAFAGKFSAAQGLAAAQSPRLETLLFNLSDDLASAKASDLIAGFKQRLASAGVSGFLFGRNMIAAQWPTRFEWMGMIQTDDNPADPRLKIIRGDLISQCRNFVQCDLTCPLPAGFIQASSVKVRHTVMFNFKPEAPPDARERNVAAIRQMGRLPMVQSYLVEPAATLESDPNQMQWQVVGDFASVADYRAYSDAPVHLAIRDDFTAQTSRVAFLDVEL